LYGADVTHRRLPLYRILPYRRLPLYGPYTRHQAEDGHGVPCLSLSRVVSG